MDARNEDPRVVIVGAGPAGLTAAFELATRHGLRPIVLEADRTVGGISRTVVWKGNRIDVGGHRFFSKSERVMRWWCDVLPVAEDPDGADEVMLVRERLSRILFRGTLFDYPMRLSPSTLWKLGPLRTLRMGMSYLRAALVPRRPERSLEDFFVNRFGHELYATFFRDYTEKVWGVPCTEIDPDWGAQRVKGLSVTKAVLHALRSLVPRGRDLSQQETETSLIERFLYPKFGPGQLWETVARRAVEGGATLRMGCRAVGLAVTGRRIAAVLVEDETGAREELPVDWLLSSMPIRHLVEQLGPHVSSRARAIAAGLRYRDFITVGLLLRRMRVPGGGGEDGARLPDNWIYVQEPEVRLGRLQIFNNWSPYLVARPDRVWLGLEYFCDEGDDLWTMDDETLRAFATDELVSIGMAEKDDVLDGVVLRMPKTYPCYFGSYGDFPALREELDGFENLLCLGRNGQHRYNNADHSMLTALEAVDVIRGRGDRARLWSVNTEADYHEEGAPPHAGESS